MRAWAPFLVFGLWAATTGIASAAVFYPTEFTLPNGLHIVVVPNRLAPAVSQMVWYKVGSGDEEPGKTGLAHYLEHLMFRGTEKIGPGEFSKAVAAQGGEDNAFTSRDYTAYYEKVAADRLGMAMRMEADRMQNLRIEDKTAAPELQVILRERQQRTGNSPEGRFVEDLQNKFMPNHPYGRPVIGWARDIEGLKPSDARKFYETHYAPNNAVVVISGDVKVEEVKALAAATYGRVPAREVPARRAVGSAPQPDGEDFEARDERVEQAEIVWRIVAPSYATAKGEAAYAYEVLAEVLGGGKVGILYKELVAGLKVASGVNVDYDPDARGETGFTVQASLRSGVSASKLKEILRSALKKLAQRGVDAKSVDEAKKRLQRAAIFAREGLSMPGYAFGMALTTGHGVADVEAWPERIDAVTPERVNAALRSLVAEKRQIMGALLPALPVKPEAEER